MKVMKRVVFLVVVLCVMFANNNIVSAAEGDVVWTKFHNGSGNGDDKGQGIAVDSDGNVYVTGYEYNGTNDNIFVRKYDKGGNEIWTKFHNGTDNEDDRGLGIAVDSSGNVYVTGFEGNDTGSFIWVRKYDKDGIEIWTRTPRVGSWDKGCGIAVDGNGNGNVYVTGRVLNAGVDNSWVRKYDKDGTEIWTKMDDGIFYQTGYGIAVDDSSGNVYVTGFEGNNTCNYIWVRKYDEDGIEIWTRTHEGGWSIGYGIALDSSGNVYVTGRENKPHSNICIWVGKYDKDGTEIWTRTHEGGCWNIGYGIALDSSGNVYVTGCEEGTDLNKDIWVRKYSCDLKIDINTLPSAQAGEIYQANFKVNKGASPYKWTLVSGSLPLGITLYSNGEIRGLPVSDDENTFTIRATEFLGGIDEQIFSINFFNSSIAPGKIKVIGGENGYINPDKNEEAKIIFNAKESGNVKIKIYTLSGQLVTEMSHNAKAGINTVYWNGLNKENKKVATGIYIVFIKGAGMDTSTKIAVGY